MPKTTLHQEISVLLKYTSECVYVYVGGAEGELSSFCMNVYHLVNNGGGRGGYEGLLISRLCIFTMIIFLTYFFKANKQYSQKDRGTDTDNTYIVTKG